MHKQRKNAKILIIEDSETVRIVLAAALRNADYDVIEAADGMTGLMLAERWTPDLAILDLHLPDMPGVEIACLFHQRIPYLVLTMDAEYEQVKKCTDLGALGYLVKPIVIEDVMRYIHIALRRGWENLHLRNALRETQTVCKAVGILMAHQQLSEEAAYQKLVSFATAHRQRLAVVASEVLKEFHDLIGVEKKPVGTARKANKAGGSIAEWFNLPPPPAG